MATMCGRVCVDYQQDWAVLCKGREYLQGSWNRVPPDSTEDSMYQGGSGLGSKQHSEELNQTGLKEAEVRVKRTDQGLKL